MIDEKSPTAAATLARMRKREEKLAALLRERGWEVRPPARYSGQQNGRGSNPGRS